MAMVSTWMDDIRSEPQTYRYTFDWHWVSIPDGETYESSEKNPRGDVVWAIEMITGALKSDTLSRDAEQMYLKFLVHLVGDIHQPLHVGNGLDKGGNDVKVKWFGKSSNLHRVWDTDMIDGTNLSYTELAESLSPLFNKTTVKQWKNSNARDWAAESMHYREQVYDYPEDKKLGYHYSYKNMDTVRLRLAQAGIRLAALLNEIYG